MAVVLAALGPVVIPRVYGRDFEQSALIATILLAGAPFRAMADVLQAGAKGSGRPGAVFFSEAIAVVAGIATALALVRTWGVAGAAGAALVSSTTALCVTALYLRVVAPRGSGAIVSGSDVERAEFP